MNQQQLTEQNLLKGLSQFTGSENFYKDYMGCILTDGFKWLCEMAGCYWLVSDLAVLVMDNNINKEGFILGKIIKNDDDSANLLLYRDYDKGNEEFNKKNLLYTQHYKYTDFPLKDFEFYICLNELNTYTFMLKSEY